MIIQFPNLDRASQDLEETLDRLMEAWRTWEQINGENSVNIRESIRKATEHIGRQYGIDPKELVKTTRHRNLEKLF